MEKNSKEIIEFLTKLKKISVDIKNIKCKKATKEHNYIEVSGYPHWENVISNILAFFFDVNEEHQFYDLFVKAILSVYKQKTKKEINVEQYKMYTNPIREYMTINNKRIDILISGNYIIGIENKIYADLYNDLNDYYQSLEKLKDEEEKSNKNEVLGIVAIVLSLYEFETKNSKFINITYDELLTKINELIGLYIVDANNKWLLYYKEFELNILSLKGEEKMESIINADFNRYLKENHDDMEKLFELIDEDYEKKRNILILLKEKICKYRFDKYESQNSNFKSLYFLIAEKIKVEICIYLNDIYINLWPTNGDGTLIKNIIEKIRNDNFFAIVPNEKRWGWKNAYILKKRDLIEDFQLDSFAKEVEECCDKIKEVII